MKIYFIDFETDGLNGPFTELSIIDDENHKEDYKGDNVYNDFCNFLKRFKREEAVIVFWHHFMPIYLSNKFPEIYENLDGKFIIFNSIYSLYDGLRYFRYTINKITETLLNRPHKGNAKDDAKDLKDCFNKIKGDINVKKD